MTHTKTSPPCTLAECGSACRNLVSLETAWEKSHTIFAFHQESVYPLQIILHTSQTAIQDWCFPPDLRNVFSANLGIADLPYLVSKKHRGSVVLWRHCAARVVEPQPRATPANLGADWCMTPRRMSAVTDWPETRSDCWQAASGSSIKLPGKSILSCHFPWNKLWSAEKFGFKFLF